MAGEGGVVCYSGSSNEAYSAAALQRLLSMAGGGRSDGLGHIAVARASARPRRH